MKIAIVGPSGTFFTQDPELTAIYYLNQCEIAEEHQWTGVVAAFTETAVLDMTPFLFGTQVEED